LIAQPAQHSYPPQQPATATEDMTVARSDRYGHRDATAIMVAFRRGLRASELCDLQWDQINYLSNSELRVPRTLDNAALVLVDTHCYRYRQN
jgi:site-specific recombinase XerC